MEELLNLICQKEPELHEEALDSKVHDFKSQEASSINNEGFESQVKYLLTCMSEEELKRLIQDI